jgi:hypothetical protein
MAFILGQISLLVTKVKDTPLSGSPVQGMCQALEHRIAVFTAVAVCAQCSQSLCMGRVISQGKAACQGQPRIFGIGGAIERRAHQPVKFIPVSLFGFQLVNLGQVGQGV